MRTIKFRGKRIDNGEWVYGDLIHGINKGSLFICVFNTNGDHKCEKVIPETVGQFTGLTDKNGVEIYEWDMVHISISDLNNKFYESNSDESVEFQNGCFGVTFGWHGDFIKFDGFHNTTFEVIGNIHDNPELLK